MIGQRVILVIGTFLLSVLLYVDRACISSAKEPITTALGLSDKQFGWVLSAFALSYALCQTPSGILADRLGPRRILSTVVAAWSLFTGLTAASWNFASLLIIRFLFGAGEAGAFPGIARASLSWIPLQERGLVQGLNFSGSRLGAAFALPGVAWLIREFGWQQAFLFLMAVGFLWALFWHTWFRDDPAQHRSISRAELEYIVSNRQKTSSNGQESWGLSAAKIICSRNVWLAMAQYFASNFTFFFCLTWLYPHVAKRYHLGTVEAGIYAMAPLLAGALGNVVAGSWVDFLYRKGRWKLSRRLPAMAGFALAAAGLIGSVGRETPAAAVGWLALAMFGADMTLAPSWSFCIDIGGKSAGAVSGTMNMAGNLGSFATSLAFPYLLDWTGSANTFFYVGTALNLLAAGAWALVRPEEKLRGNS